VEICQRCPIAQRPKGNGGESQSIGFAGVQLPVRAIRSQVAV